MSLWQKLAGWFSGAENAAGKGLGELECEAGRPLYPITPYFAQVSPELWRGSWPNVRILAELKKLGIRTVVSLCAERREDDAVRKAGFLTSSIPVVDNLPPTPHQVEQFLRVLRFFSPVYVHCEQGKGRTGCMVAAYRVRVGGWTPEAALQEAKDCGLEMPAQKDFIRSL